MCIHISTRTRACARTQVFSRLRSQLRDKRLTTGAASSDILAPLFAAMDTDGDDCVSMPEFLSFWHQRQLSPPPHSPPALLKLVMAGSPSPSAVALQDEASQKLAENQSRPDGLEKTAQETIALGNEILRGLSVLEEALVEVCCCVCVCVCVCLCVCVSVCV